MAAIFLSAIDLSSFATFVNAEPYSYAITCMWFIRIALWYAYKQLATAPIAEPVLYACTAAAVSIHSLSRSD